MTIGRDLGRGVVGRAGLGVGEIAEVAALAGRCNEYDGLDVPLDLEDMGPQGGDEVRQVLYHEGGELVGFASLQGYREIEASGMVHPAWRRRGIGRALVAAVRDECRRRRVANWLLVVDEASSPGKAFAMTLGGAYRFSEHRLELSADRPPAPAAWQSPLRLRQAAATDLDLLTHLSAISFGDPEEGVRERFVREIGSRDKRFTIAELDGEPIGSLRLVGIGPVVYITAFGVLPAFRRRGLGRQLLARTIDALAAEGWERIMIEVETENRNALGLYLSCGFRETRTYRYYEMKVT